MLVEVGTLYKLDAMLLWHLAFDIAYMSDSDVVSGVGSSGGVSQEFNQRVAKEARAQTAAGAGTEDGAVLTPAVGCCSLAPGHCRLCQTCCMRTSAANRLIGEDVQSRRRPLLGPSPG